MSRAENIANYLKKFKKELPKIYPWSPKLDNLFGMNFLSNEEVNSLKDIKLSNDIDTVNYDREIKLKKILNNHLTKFNSEENNERISEIANWIIRDWGGINTKNDNKKIINDILKERGNMYFDRIASSSKIGAFMFPEDLIIYDSRVAYSLNWILLTTGEEKDFFPIPEGRNSKMMAFDMNVLIRLKLKEKYRPSDTSSDNKKLISKIDNKVYYSKKTAYQKLNDLIKEVHVLLWEDDCPKELYYTEMLLFSIADKQIYLDIINKVEFNINN